MPVRPHYLTAQYDPKEGKVVTVTVYDCNDENDLITDEPIVGAVAIRQLTMDNDPALLTAINVAMTPAKAATRIATTKTEYQDAKNKPPVVDPKPVVMIPLDGADALSP
jgi:hypothetical protein